MKKKQILKAIETLQIALSHKFDGGSDAQLIITSDEVSLDAPDGEVIVDHDSNFIAAEKLES